MRQAAGRGPGLGGAERCRACLTRGALRPGRGSRDGGALGPVAGAVGGAVEEGVGVDHRPADTPVEPRGSVRRSAVATTTAPTARSGRRLGAVMAAWCRVVDDQAGGRRGTATFWATARAGTAASTVHSPKSRGVGPATMSARLRSRRRTRPSTASTMSPIAARTRCRRCRGGPPRSSDVALSRTHRYQAARRAISTMPSGPVGGGRSTMVSLVGYQRPGDRAARPADRAAWRR